MAAADDHDDDGNDKDDDGNDNNDNDDDDDDNDLISTALFHCNSAHSLNSAKTD